MKAFRVFLYFLGAISILIGCSQQEDIKPFNPVDPGNVPSQWLELVRQINLDHNIYLVKKDGSIQEVLDYAEGGDIIVIEPGIYREAITIETDVCLIGLLDEQNEGVVIENPVESTWCLNPGKYILDLYNVQCRDFAETDADLRAFATTNQPSARRRLLKIERDELGDQIAHYKIELRVGPGEFDVIGLHRVVREYRPYHPTRTRGDIFMIHGSIQDFEDIFLVAGAEEINATTSAPYYWADKGIDVWGIDLAWTRIPLEIPDVTFMKEWGVEKDVDHTMAAMKVARLIRVLTRQGFNELNLLGFSYGVPVAYGAAGRETQLLPVFRNIKGLIQGDGFVKYGPEHEALRLESCQKAAKIKSMLESGMYHTPGGTFLMKLGVSALAEPDQVSPDFGPLTNAQAINFVASDHSGNFHFCGGTYEDLYYADPLRFARLAADLTPHMPRQLNYDTNACQCNEEEVSYEDHLREINLPIFNLTAEGGSGALGDYTVSITASRDITYLNVDDPLQDDHTRDFGHGDLWLGYDASQLVWEPLRKWLLDH